MSYTPPMPANSADGEALAKRLYEELDRLNKAANTSVQIAANQINVPVGTTPKEQIWALNKAKLYHYYPTVPAEKRHPVPLLLVFALINRPYIFDLRPGNSFIEYMLNQGYEIYLLDWGTPGLEDSHYTFEDFALNYLPRAVRALKRHSGKKEFSLLGWCIGAMICTIYAAQRPNDGLRNLLLLTAPLDFSNKEAGPFNRWLTTEHYNVDELVRQQGNVPGELIDYGNKLLKPVENFIGNYLKLWDNLDNRAVVESWLAMNTWVTDYVAFPGGAFRQWINDFYRGDKLMQGSLMMGGRPVDLRDITCSFLNVIADKDHIVPNCQSTTVMDRIGSQDKLLLEMRGGHIGMMVGSGASKRVWPQIDGWLAKRST
jgi:polyhydroxyalkanoate synthase subunit PhaC